MIDVKDLRISNLVKSKNPQYRPNELGKFLYVTKVDSENDSIGCFVYEELPFAIQFGQYLKFVEPIPLTEDILLKCFFRLAGKSEFKIGFDLEQNHKFSYKFNIVDKTQWLEYIGMVIDCNYLHELQNIYYLLTKQELEINL